MPQDSTLSHALLEAVKECNHTLEEEGGIILNKENDYLFVKIKSIFSGTPTAIGLYETDKSELGKKVLMRMSSEGWQMYASFHTHPSFSAEPSNTDMTYLFRGFKHNYIYAPRSKYFSLTSWEGDECSTQYTSRKQIESLLEK